jgi:hypothetical protein
LKLNITLKLNTTYATSASISPMALVPGEGTVCEAPCSTTEKRSSITVAALGTRATRTSVKQTRPDVAMSAAATSSAIGGIASKQAAVD